MNILNSICFGCATFLTGVALVVSVVYFFLGIYACFSKKMQGTLLAKIAVVVGFGCAIPILLRLGIFFVEKMLN